MHEFAFYTGVLVTGLFFSDILTFGFRNVLNYIILKRIKRRQDEARKDEEIDFFKRQLSALSQPAEEPTVN